MPDQIMEKGITFQGYVPIRKEPDHTSEMVSQVLFGEEFRILDTTDKWLHISLDFDEFEGWVEKQSVYQVGLVNEPEKGIHSEGRMVSSPFITALDLRLCQQIILPTGAMWPNGSGKTISLHGYDFEILSEDGLITPGPDVDPEEIGRGLISLPYLWGGRSGFGFDSPGLVQMLCRMMGESIPRHCDLQSKLGTTINFVHEIQRGDLAFFDNEEGEIVHVGMALDAGRILHISTDVRIDRFDLYGIYCMEKETYTHKLRLIRRVIG